MTIAQVVLQLGPNENAGMIEGAPAHVLQVMALYVVDGQPQPMTDTALIISMLKKALDSQIENVPFKEPSALLRVAAMPAGLRPM